MPNGAAVTLSFLVFCLLQRPLKKKKKKAPLLYKLAAEDLDFHNQQPLEKGKDFIIW